nr:hypothetical protein [uncultured bacterium]
MKNDTVVNQPIKKGGYLNSWNPSPSCRAVSEANQTGTVLKQLDS